MPCVDACRNVPNVPDEIFKTLPVAYIIIHAKISAAMTMIIALTLKARLKFVFEIFKKSRAGIAK